jgi:hypothetical protein
VALLEREREQGGGSNDGCNETPARCVEARIQCFHYVRVVGVAALRRWALHSGGLFGVVPSASLVSLSASDHIGGSDVCICVDCEWSCRDVSSSLSSSCIVMWPFCCSNLTGRRVLPVLMSQSD